MASSNYARMREQTMGSMLEEEAVTVNTRALIDKVLARYSGEWTTLRELIQNAADARASRVTIRFETTPSATVPLPQSTAPSDRLKHTLLHHTLKTLLVSNDGDVFGENDWSRLKRIAEGNPDETKIGAFGVGFYSVFADCESPFVSSGDQTMAFYWKKDSLFTRRGKLPQEQATKETTFLLDYRSTSTPMPQLLSLCQFLATSLTFVGLAGIDLFLDEWHILKLSKKMAPGVDISLPRDVNPKTRDGLMKIIGVEYQNAQIDAQWMNVVGWDRSTTPSNRSVEQPQNESSGSLRGWLSKIAGGINSTSVASKRAQKEEEALQLAIAEDLAGFSNATVFLRLSTVSVQTFVSRSLSQELERATKKPPPKHTKIAILTSSYDEASASMSTFSGAGSKNATAIFASVLPTKNGKIFIGFPTAQTTGLLAHISAPSVIPTVERESIDLNARYVRDWNIEMLRVAGIACRVAFTGEMAELKARLDRSLVAAERKKLTKEDIDAIMPAAVHVFKQYNYEESTPSSKVGQYIEEAFWTCNQKASIDVLSTRGILSSQQVRVATEDLSFVEGIPVVPEELMKKAPEFIGKLRDYGLLSDITTSDIKRELEAQALSEKQLTELLKWACAKVNTHEYDAAVVQNLFDGTIATVDLAYIGTSESPIIQLGQLKTYVNVAKIPAEMPTPSHTIPFRITKGLNLNHLSMIGLEELNIVPWLRWIVETDGRGFGNSQTFTTSPTVAGQVLPVVSRGWDSLSAGSKNTVTELLVVRTVIPTKQGMKKPPQSYFASVKLFDDLPTINGLQGVKEKFLATLGVRKTVELNVVFDRLMSKTLPNAAAEEGKWSHFDLIKYLLSVKDDIPAEDIKRLRNTPICPAENKDGKAKGQLYRLSELYEPSESVRKLGLPVLQWPGVYRGTSPEGKFLRSLGLNPYPDVPALVDILSKAPANSEVQLTALQYLISNNFHHGYSQYPMAKIDKPFLPVELPAGEKVNSLARPTQCFANPKAAFLGFKVLRADLQPHHAIFGVSMDPPIDHCAERLMKQPPLDRQQALTLFGYFAGRLNEISPTGSLADRLGMSPIVPVLNRNNEKRMNVKFVAPRNVFLGDSDAYGDIFDFVDFGLEANSFLLRIGSKHEPSASELAQMVVRQPGRLLETLGHEKYLQLLRRLAENSASLKKDKSLWNQLKQTPCLLASKDVAKVADSKSADQDDEEFLVREWSLANAFSMVIVDDFNTYRLFQASLLCVPQEEALENFYAALETPFLSKLIEDDQRTGAPLRDQSTAQTLQKLIVERSRLFLHDHTSDVIRHDAKWLEQNMTVKVTEFLQVTHRLKGYKMHFVEKRTAALHRESKRDATLYITARYDLFEVSRALMHLLLKRPRQQDYLALETLMASDLNRLKTKGYNVDRILRAKAAESRIAASEKKKREEEQRKLTEQANATAVNGTNVAVPNGKANDVIPEPQATPDRSLSMPGAFAESPEQAANTGLRGKKMSNIFNQLSRQLGMSSGNSDPQHNPMQQLQSMLGGNHFPPPNDAGPIPGRTITPGTERVTSPKELQNNLSSAISASRAWNSNTVFNRPQSDNIKETPSYCDSRPGHDLTFVADLGQGIKFFLSREHSGPSAFMQTHKEALAAFVVVLVNCAAIFDLPAQTINIYHDESGAAIAFNTNGSIFCNLRYFIQLHEDGMSEPQGRLEAMAYWWITLCHELAHNLVEEHSARHSYYTESFAHHYFGRMVWWIGRNIGMSGP